jgi:hypothetical protein
MMQRLFLYLALLARRFGTVLTQPLVDHSLCTTAFNLAHKPGHQLQIGLNPLALNSLLLLLGSVEAIFLADGAFCIVSALHHHLL